MGIMSRVASASARRFGCGRRATTVEILPTNDGTEISHGFTDGELDAVTRWVTELDLGKRVSYNVWQLRDEVAVTMFLLRWNG